jgi:LAO/AO transport system kinase
MPLASAEEIIHGVLEGDKRSIARAISIIENEQPEAQKIISMLYSSTGKAYVIGITGSGGCGKSTLVEKLVGMLRCKGKTVGVVAVDPSSPFTGGAFLGDRIRMQELSTMRAFLSEAWLHAIVLEGLRGRRRTQCMFWMLLARR